MTVPSMISPSSHAAPLGERAAVVALVVAAHAALMYAWWVQPEPPVIAVSEMSVSVAVRQAETAKPQAQAEPIPPKPQPRIERAEKPVAKPPVQDEAKAAPQPVDAPPVAAMPVQTVTAPPAVAAAPVIDTAPDYKAAYLNNPRPAYPMAARRMGWEGRVVLNVEVLAEGSCGNANVLQSSGHEVLDNAALRTVKGWRFVPASRAGRPVTQWFKVPIQFSLKENEA